MKTSIAILCSLLLTFPVHQSRSQLVPALCITAFAAIAVGGIVVVVQSCKPKYWVIEDEENHLKYCKITTKREAQLDGLKIVAGPFADATQCDRVAHPTNLLAKVVSMVTIEKSTDLVNWTVAGEVAGTADCFEFTETNRVDSVCFYRVRY